MNTELQATLKRYLEACQESVTTGRDPLLSAQGKREKANKIMADGVARLQAYLDQVEAQTRKVTANVRETETDFQTLAPTDETDRAWQRMEPFRQANWELEKMVMYAATAADLAAIATYGKPYLTMQMSNKNHGVPVPVTQVDDAFAALEGDLTAAMDRLNINENQRAEHAQHKQTFTKLFHEREYLRELIAQQCHPARLDIKYKAHLGYADRDTFSWLNDEIRREWQEVGR